MLRIACISIRRQRMIKVKRPTLATTKNSIRLLKDIFFMEKEPHVKYQVGMVLTMLTNDESWMVKR